MARIDIKSAGGGSVATGVLQLENGVAMDATLRKVADQNNTTSPLKLSTTGIQATSKIQITTADTNYIDAEDNAGNNRFTVGRGVGSQLVTVDFASVPTDLTTAVGAIRTATNGSALANVQTFLENGNIGFGTDTPGSKIDVHSAANTVAQFNRTGTGNSQIQHLMTGTARWTTGYTNTAGNYSIYDNVNSVFRTNLSNTGKLTIGNGDTALTGVLNIKGSGSTSATTSLLVQNSSSTTTFSVNDAGELSLGSTAPKITLGGNLTITSTVSPTREMVYDVINGNLSIYSGSLGEGYFIGNKLLTDRTSSTFVTPNGINAVGNALITAYDSNGNASINASNNGNRSIVLKGLGTSGAVLIGNITTGNGSVYSAILQADSTTQGFLPPRMTTAQKNAIATPAAGLMVYDTTLNKLCVRTAAAWETITSI